MRINIIALAADNNDIKMLNNLRARETPQLYYRAHYLGSGNQLDFDSSYNEKMIKHIASSSEEILEYFTDSFEIRDYIKYNDGSKRAHTFMFPYISKLLDLLIKNRSPFTETALKKVLKYNEQTYRTLCELILSVKNDDYFNQEYMKDMWKKTCEQCFDFSDNGDIVSFIACVSKTPAKNQLIGIITNVAKVTKIPTSPILKHLAEELNESYDKIKTIKEHLEEI